MAFPVPVCRITPHLLQVSSYLLMNLPNGLLRNKIDMVQFSMLLFKKKCRHYSIHLKGDIFSGGGLPFCRGYSQRILSYADWASFVIDSSVPTKIGITVIVKFQRAFRSLAICRYLFGLTLWSLGVGKLHT